jgi:pimeloyl-ACP methyl ester carboxylesterase
LSQDTARDRECEFSTAVDTLGGFSQISYGEEDTIVLPSATEEHAELISNATVLWYPDVGHLSPWETPKWFNHELREFVSGL